MIIPDTVRYDGQLAGSLCCSDIGGLSTVPVALGESFCPGQPVSLNDLGEAISGTGNFVGIADSQNIGVDVTYTNLGGVACNGIPIFGDGDDVFAGIELRPAATFTLTDLNIVGGVWAREHEYAVTFIQENCNGTFESDPSFSRKITTTLNPGTSIQIDSIPTGIYADTTKRNVYRRPTDDIYTLITPVSVVASSEEPTNPAADAIDDNFVTYWVNNGAQPVSANDAVLDIDLGSIQTIERWRNYWVGFGFAMNDFDVEGSLDGILYFPITLGVTDGYNGGLIQRELLPSVNTKHIRVTYKAGTGQSPTFLGVVEFQVFVRTLQPFKLVTTINDNVTTTFIDDQLYSALVNQQPPLVSGMQDSLTDMLQVNFLVGTYDLASGCLNIISGEEGCIAASCLKSLADMTPDEFAVEINPCSWDMFQVNLENPSIPRQLRHWDLRGTSRKVRRLITLEGQIRHGGESGKLKGINALNGVWRTAATPSVKNDGFYLLEWIGADGLKYSTQAQVFGNKPIIDINGECNKFYTAYSVELVSSGEIFVGDEITQIVEEGHVAGMDIGLGAVSISQTGLSDLENPTIVDLTDLCNRDSEIPMDVHISWTGLQDPAELLPNTGDNALGLYIASYILFANASTGTAIKFNVNFKRTDTIDIDKNGVVYYNGVENPTIVDSVVSIPPTLISGELNTLILTDSSYWGEKAHGKLIQAETSYFNVI